jgi:hypothetical protein
MYNYQNIYIIGLRLVGWPPHSIHLMAANIHRSTPCARFGSVNRLAAKIPDEIESERCVPIVGYDVATDHNTVLNFPKQPAVSTSQRWMIMSSNNICFQFSNSNQR